MTTSRGQNPNEQLIARWVDAINQRSFDRFDDLFSSSYVNHNPPPGGQSAGIEGLKLFFRELCDGLEGFRYTIEELSSRGNRVRVRLSGRGRHVGEVMGAAPTGEMTDVTVTHVFEVSNGKIRARWGDPADPPMLRAARPHHPGAQRGRADPTGR
jgi:predicted ester cyclase